MTDDIVTRLRIEKQNCLLMNNGNPFLLVDAIDEIERLRLVITCLQNEVLRLAEIAWKAEVD